MKIFVRYAGPLYLNRLSHKQSPLSTIKMSKNVFLFTILKVLLLYSEEINIGISMVQANGLHGV